MPAVYEADQSGERPGKCQLNALPGVVARIDGVNVGLRAPEIPSGLSQDRPKAFKRECYGGPQW